MDPLPREERLLPKNPWLADWLIAQALGRRYGEGTPLAPLDDTLERAAHDAAITHAESLARQDRTPRVRPVPGATRRVRT